MKTLPAIALLLVVYRCPYSVGAYESVGSSAAAAGGPKNQRSPDHDASSPYFNLNVDGYSPPDDSAVVNWKGYYHAVSKALPSLSSLQSGSEGDDASSSHADQEMMVTTGGEENDIVTAVLSDIAISSDDLDNAPYELEDLSATVSLLRHYISDPLFVSSVPEELKGTILSLNRQLSSAENHMEKLVEIVSEHYEEYETLPNDHPSGSLQSSSTSGRHRRLLSGGQLYPSPGEYNMRARTPDPNTVLGRGHPGGQQGHYNSRVQREEGTTRRRLRGQDDDDDTDTTQCVDVDPDERKAEQCFRLANCAKNYNLYDMFVFFFGDDIDFDTGKIDDKISVYDEADLKGKLKNDILPKSAAILEKYNSTTVTIIPGNENTLLKDAGDDSCDSLLQEFHRFDEEISVNGKWQGGTVTGVCRGWGTTRYISLESIYQISDNALSNVKENVETCMQELVDDFNANTTNFTVPDTPCKVELDAGITDQTLKTQVIEDIKSKFQCLENSFKWKINVHFDDSACFGMWPSFPIFRGSTAASFPLRVFDYGFPIVLPPPEDRLNFGVDFFGAFLLDLVPVRDNTAETFIVDMFEEFFKCANDIGKELLGKSDNLFLFENNETTNPFTPNGNGQLSLPTRVLGSDKQQKDVYGQITGKYLDEIFKYHDIGGDKLLEANGTAFSEELKNNIIKAYAFSEQISDWIKMFDDAGNDYLKALLESLKQSIFVDRGLDRSVLDTSIALLFGNKTTVGQVCTYAKGLKDKTVESLPGFCCMDAPYEADDWGEMYSCTEYYEEKGFTKARGKTEENCTNLAPFTAGFNQAACDVFSGTWCPVPRDCRKLRNCVEDLKGKVGTNGDRQAFFEYLSDAPAIKDESALDPKECGEFREYFEYDRDFPDDDRICEEIADLQCLTDFSNLDGLATGGKGDGGEEELAVSTKLRVKSKERFDATGAKVWRSTNFALTRAIDTFNFIYEKLQTAKDVCIVGVSFVVGTAAPCVVPLGVVAITVSISKFVLVQAVSISERIYDEIVVNKVNFDYNTDVTMTMYDNIITSFGNINVVFAATQQLKVILGNIAEDLAESEEEEDERRRLEKACTDEDKCYLGDCDCEDPFRFCDCTFNFPYVSSLRSAGCDGLDSDGDGDKDNCEDRFPPELMNVNAEIFRCDEEDTSRLCYNGQVFQSDKEARNFLDYQFGPADDCQASNKLGVHIESSGTCGETLFTLTPFQNITSCDTEATSGFYNITFENPLNGPIKEVTLNVDEENPEVSCGFHDIHHINVVENKTLFYYVHDNEDPEDLADANFFYNITDNCPADVDVDVVVKSNEYEHGTMANLVKVERDSSVKQSKFFFRPSSCKTGKSSKSKYCEKDGSLPINLRVYDVTVTATDSGGRSSADTCRVIIVPPCKKKGAKTQKSLATENEHCEHLHYHHPNHPDDDHHGHENHTRDDYPHVHVHGDYYKLDYVSNLADASDHRYEIVSMDLIWNSSLEPPPPKEFDAFALADDLFDEELDEDLDIAGAQSGAFLSGLSFIVTLTTFVLSIGPSFSG